MQNEKRLLINYVIYLQLLRNDTSLTILLNLLKYYIDKDLEISRNQNENNTSNDLDVDVVDDIIVKVIM